VPTIVQQTIIVGGHVAAALRRLLSPPYGIEELCMEAGRIINRGQAAGQPQMGQGYSGSYPAFPGNSLQIVSLDKAGAQLSNGEGRKPTYSSALIAYTPYATPQDVVGIIGSASKQIRVLRFAVSGRAASANQLDVQLVKRASADTGGTPSALTAV